MKSKYWFSDHAGFLEARVFGIGRHHRAHLPLPGRAAVRMDDHKSK